MGRNMPIRYRIRRSIDIFRLRFDMPCPVAGDGWRRNYRNIEPALFLVKQFPVGQRPVIRRIPLRERIVHAWYSLI